MSQNKKLHNKVAPCGRVFFLASLRLGLVVALTLVFTAGSIGVGIFASRVAGELQTSVVKEKKAKHKKKAKRVTSALIAQHDDLKPLQVQPINCGFVEPEKPEYKGEFIEREIRVSAAVGGKFTVKLYLKNTGNVPWFSATSGCSKNHVKLGTGRDRDRASIFFNTGDPAWLSAERISMMESRVEPGEFATFTFTSKAPFVTDIFREYFQPVVEGVQWMEQKEETARVDIFVGFVPPEYEKSLFYLNKTAQASSIDASGELMVDVDLSEQKMLVKLGEQVIREFKVSTGTFNTPTPVGNFEILNKQELRIGSKWPHYHMPKWQGFTKWGHGLHSLPYLANDRGVFWNEALSHIGQRVSHGCIRVLPDNAEDLFNLTTIGAKVVIHY